MAHAHESNAGKIWKVFGILSFITIIEVVLGIYKPHTLYFTEFLGTNLLNWIFIILTIAKAYGIMWSFMHLEGETFSLRFSITGPLIFLIIYLVSILLVEGGYIFEVFKNSTIKWNF